MNPYKFVKQATDNGESLLSLCSGIGLEFNNLSASDVTAVDISATYLIELNRNHSGVKTVASDALHYARVQPDNSVDVVTLIDGLEHMTKARGKELLGHIKRIARKKVLLFFPEGEAEGGYLKNDPHNAWDIGGQDEYQTHKSGWTKDEAIKLGFTLIAEAKETSQHGEPYTALMFTYNKE